MPSNRGYNPDEQMPWTARKVALRNPEPDGQHLGRLCLEHLETNPPGFWPHVRSAGRDYGLAPSKKPSELL